jgi:hypothetical protein
MGSWWCIYNQYWFGEVLFQIVAGDVQAAEAFAEEFVVGILDGHGWIITAA